MVGKPSNLFKRMREKGRLGQGTEREKRRREVEPQHSSNYNKCRMT